MESQALGEKPIPPVGSSFDLWQVPFLLRASRFSSVLLGTPASPLQSSASQQGPGPAQGFMSLRLLLLPHGMRLYLEGGSPGRCLGRGGGLEKRVLTWTHMRIIWGNFGEKKPNSYFADFVLQPRQIDISAGVALQSLFKVSTGLGWGHIVTRRAGTGEDSHFLSP